MAEHIIGGRYRLRSVLGRYGRVTTYQAETTDTGESVVVRGFPTPDEATARAAELEAQARTRLVDPALPRVREHVADALNGKPGRFVIEDHPRDLEAAADVIARRGGLPEAEVIGIAHALLGALGTLHASGFTYPMLSPAQVLIAPGGRALLVDWGEPPAAKGSPSSPEIPARAPGSPDADLRALGVTLALMLTGRTADPARIVDDVRPRAPRLAPWIAQLVADPPWRFPTAQAAREALRAAIREPIWRTVPQWALVASGATVGVLVLFAALGIVVARSAAASRTREATAARERYRESRRDRLASLTATNQGCADGTREAFKDLLTYPEIAGCSGAFKVPGILGVAPPSCRRAAGNDGANPMGAECNASDLCAEGFHVCASAAEVVARSTTGCEGARDAPPASFFATRQSGPGCDECATGADPNCDHDACHAGCAPTASMTSGLFGCGNRGEAARTSCAPLNRASGAQCRAIGSSWHCYGGDPSGESLVVTKPDTTGGGVLCCED